MADSKDITVRDGAANPADDGPETSLTGLIYWTAEKRDSRGELSPADQARAIDCFRRLMSGGRGR